MSRKQDKKSRNPYKNGRTTLLKSVLDPKFVVITSIDFFKKINQVYLVHIVKQEFFCIQILVQLYRPHSIVFVFNLFSMFRSKCFHK